jgi:hypothetical protein
MLPCFDFTNLALTATALQSCNPNNSTRKQGNLLFAALFRDAATANGLMAAFRFLPCPIFMALSHNVLQTGLSLSSVRHRVIDFRDGSEVVRDGLGLDEGGLGAVIERRGPVEDGLGPVSDGFGAVRGRLGLLGD